MTARAITEALPGGRWHGSYGLAFCPAHKNTKTPALSLSDGSDGKLLVFCHAGCDGTDVLAALRSRGLLAGHSDWRPDPREIERRKAEEDADRQRRIDARLQRDRVAVLAAGDELPACVADH